MLKEEEKIQRLFRRACADYALLADGDRVLVALSGGKDSLELLRQMARQATIHKPRITVEAAHVIMDNIPYETDRSYLQQFCHDLGITLYIIHSSFDDSETTDTTKQRKRRTRCFLCSWNRRKALFRFACDNGFNKIALGHHQDDILTTLLMNMTFEGSIQTMPPLLRLENYSVATNKGNEPLPLCLIRPLCLVPESLIRTVASALAFTNQKVPCPYEETTKRSAINDIFHSLEALNPEARYSLWRSMQNIKPSLLP